MLNYKQCLLTNLVWKNVSGKIFAVKRKNYYFKQKKVRLVYLKATLEQNFIKSFEAILIH